MTALLIMLLQYTFAVQPFVDAPAGPILGLDHGNYLEFLGIRFGHAERFARSQFVPRWTKTFNATSFGPECPQAGSQRQSEDCLFLNVWAPKRNSTVPFFLPVMVWFYGGGFTMGSSSQLDFQGSLLCQSSTTPVIVVSFNYRIEAFGWLAGLGFKGNYGLSDQRLALQWVNLNIAAFGGDKDRVTIFGQSAGAISVLVHYTSKPSWPFFRSAISESPVPGLGFRTVAESESYALELALRLGCLTAACLRDATVDDIVAASQPPLSIGYTVDRYLLRWQPTVEAGVVDYDSTMEAVKHLAPPNKTLMIGTTTNESALFIYQFVNFNTSVLDFEAIVGGWFGFENLDAIMQMYPVADDHEDRKRAVISSITNQFVRIGTDNLFFCPTRQIALNMPQSSDVYLYQFAHAPSYDPNCASFCWNRFACHQAEIPYVLHLDRDGTPLLNQTAEEKQLGVFVQSIWQSFAYDTTHLTSQFKWPRFTPSSNLSLAFLTPDSRIEQNYRQRYCDFWNSLVIP